MTIGKVKQAWKAIYVSQLKIGKSDVQAARYTGVSNSHVINGKNSDQEFADQCTEAKTNRPQVTNW